MILKYELVRIRKEKQCLLKYLGILLKGLSKITKKIQDNLHYRYTKLSDGHPGFNSRPSVSDNVGYEGRWIW